MAVCTFFGHRDCPEEIRPKLRETLVRFIEDYGVDQFYVGNQGAFDRIAREVLCRLKKESPYPVCGCAGIHARKDGKI